MFLGPKRNVCYSTSTGVRGEALPGPVRASVRGGDSESSESTEQFKVCGALVYSPL